MYPVLPFGPFTLPTGPILTMVAIFLGLDIAGRFGRRFSLHPDDVWNTGLLVLATGLIVARLWNVFQFWYIYRAEPFLILSLRPSGFELLPGLIAGLIGGYAYLLRRALDPTKVAAALSVGVLAASGVLAISGHMTGALIGTPTELPWALPYFGENRHPVGLYQALGFWVAVSILWTWKDARPIHTLAAAALSYSLVRLITDGFIDNAMTVGSFRVSQVVALVVAVIMALWLARLEGKTRMQTASAAPI